MLFRIHRMKDQPRENFRWAAHTGGQAVVKQKDYDASGEIEAASEYAAWKALAAHGEPLQPGDVLEITRESGQSQLRILKYIGFEPAVWWVFTPKAGSEQTSGDESSLNTVQKSQEFAPIP